MPRRVKSKQDQEAYTSDFMEEENIKPQEKAPQPKANKKRTCIASETYSMDEEEAESSGFEQDEDMPMTSILNQFSDEIKKTVQAKRRKLENFTKQCNANRGKVATILESQKKDRVALKDEYKKQITSILTQWETDVEKAKETEEKINSLLNQQMKLVTQIRMVQVQRFKSMKQLHEHFMKSVDEVEAKHTKQSHSVTQDAAKEMQVLQKKLMTDLRKQEVASMKKSFVSMMLQQ